jgi:hypothetical protein
LPDFILVPLPPVKRQVHRISREAVPQTITGQVENNALALAGCGAETAPYHLDVECLAECWPREENGVNCGNVEPLPEQGDVAEHE